MTRKTRRFIFYTFIVLFIVLAIGVILYAQGYSFDWQKKSLIVTGAFYFQSHPKDADIYINNEYKGKTNKYIKRLFPGEYDVKISKPDYYDWQKTLEINSKVVTEAKNVLLVKKDPSINQVIDYNIRYFSFSNDNKKAIYLTDKATKEIDPTKQKIADPREIPTYSKFALRLLDLTNNADTQINSSIADLKNLSNLLWSNDDKKIILSFLNGDYYVLNLDQVKPINFNDLIKSLSNYKIYNAENLSFHPRDSNKIYFYFENNLYSIELNFSNPYESVLISSPIVSDILVYTIFNDDILYIKYSDGAFYRTNLETSSFKKIFDIPLLEPNQTVKIISDEILVIDKVLYFFNSQTQTLEKITSGVEEIQFSSNNEKMLWKTKNEIGVIWFKADPKQPLREKYETEIAMKTFEEINQAVWHSKSNEHIIFTLGNDIKITELDNRDKRNTVNVLSIKNPKIFNNEWNKNIYILSEQKLFEVID